MTYFPCNRTPTLGSSKGNRVSNYKILKNKLAIIVIANPDETFRCTILEPLHFLKFDKKISFKPGVGGGFGRPLTISIAYLQGF